MGEAPDQMVLVETPEDVERLEVPDPDKVAYLTQTTLSVDDANIVIAALRKKFPQIANPPKDDICYATQNRQEAVRELAARADVVLVLGSQNSSNSQRLAEIAQSLGIPSHLIDGVSEIRPSWFEEVETVLITAGASAPEDVVQECIEYLSEPTERRSRRRTSGKRTSTSPYPSRSASCFPPSASAAREPLADHEARRRARPISSSRSGLNLRAPGRLAISPLCRWTCSVDLLEVGLGGETEAVVVLILASISPRRGSIWRTAATTRAVTWIRVIVQIMLEPR